MFQSISQFLQWACGVAADTARGAAIIDGIQADPTTVLQIRSLRATATSITGHSTAPSDLIPTLLATLT